MNLSESVEKYVDYNLLWALGQNDYLYIKFKRIR